MFAWRQTQFFAMPEVRAGDEPRTEWHADAPRHAGGSQAMDLLLTGRRFSAEEALAMGLVTRLSAADRLREEAGEVAGQLAAMDPGAVATLKRALREGGDLPLKDALALERRLVILSSSN